MILDEFGICDFFLPGLKLYLGKVKLGKYELVSVGAVSNLEALANILGV